MYRDTKYINTPLIQCCLILWSFVLFKLFLDKTGSLISPLSFSSKLTKQKKEHHFLRKERLTLILTRSKKGKILMVVERRRSWSFESISIWLSPGFVTHPQSHVSALNLFSVWITNARVHAKVGQIEIDYNLSVCKHLAKSVLDIISRKRSLA